MSLVRTGAACVAFTGSSLKNTLVCTNADAVNVALGSRVVLTDSGGTLKEKTVFVVYDKPSAFGFTNMTYSPNSALLAATGDRLEVVADDWVDYVNPLSLTVRLVTSRTDVHIEDQVRDLSFRSVIPGGYASATFSLNRPLRTDPNEIALFGKIFIYDGRHGGVIWEGQLEDPGRGTSDQGEIWELTAIGPSAHVNDRVAPYILVDKSLERWERSRYSTSDADTDNGELNDGLTTPGIPALIVSASEGTTVTTSWRGDWIYRGLYYAGQYIARIRCEHREDITDSNYRVKISGRIGDGTENYQQTQNWSTTPQAFSANLGSLGWVTGTDVVSLRGQRDNSNTTAGASTAAYFVFVVIRAALMNADGTPNNSTSGYTGDTVDPVEVVADLLGRFLPRYDGASAILLGSGVDIDQLAYPDGVSPGQVLDDIAVYDPAFFWAAWESNAAGKHRFEYRPWPTTVRYEASTIDGFHSPGSAADLYNRVTVRWKDAAGDIRSTTRTQAVPELDNATPSVIREFYIDLSDETGSEDTAIYTGDNFLEEHRYPPNAGTLTVSRPIVDNISGRTVQPWEILPGSLIRVVGVSPRVDSLNPSARDGVTVFKVVSMEYSTASVAATLELDSYSRTVARALANLQTRRLRKR